MALCQRCTKIPFNAIFEGRLEGLKQWRLGKYSDVRVRECSFCQLVAPIYEKFCMSRQPPNDNEIISVFRFSGGLSIENTRIGTDIFFVADTKSSRSSDGPVPVPARASFDEWIDLADVKDWIAACDSKHRHHEDCSPVPFNPAILPRNDKRQLDFRLIDVEAMCIVYAPRKAKYVALSYVWGRTSRTRLTLTSNNEEALTQPMALKSKESIIPPTIRDAITVVRELGERYLWVDSLCLLQDDEWELRECVAIMDLFYEMAAFTIIAADGEDAFAGLEGVPPTKRRTQANPIKEIAPGLKMTAIFDVDTLLRGSTYSSRAWTMQEEILSRRVLIFISGQIYWKCSESYLDERLNGRDRGSLYDQHNAKGSLKYTLLRGDEDSDFIDFCTILEYYMRRQLSFESDVLRAAQGMLRKFSMLSGLHCFQGLPPPLARSMLFAKGGKPYSGDFGRRYGFPSYSWTGWKSSPWYHDTCQHGDFRSQYSGGNPDSLNELDLHSWIRWHCVFEDGQIYRLNEAGRMYKAPEPKSEDTRKNAIKVLSEIPLYGNTINFNTVRPKSYPLLLFWTVVVSLRLRYQKKAPTYPNVRVEFNENVAHLNYGVVVMDIADPGGEMRLGKFAILASSARGYWALLLKRENGFAERRGVVLLRKDVLEKCLEPGPRWEPIVLG